MSMPRVRAAALAALLVVSALLGSEARGQFNRRTPIVEAVRKTRASIVSIRVEKADENDQTKKLIGTGVVVDGRGYILTNWHVVSGANVIHAYLADGTEHDGELFFEDPHTDLAIIHIQAPGQLKVLPLGPGSDLMVGETVIAIGHPYGYTNTVSTGIISALGRQITMPSGETLTNLVQTDASINPGNSGGPLLNINGELVAINVALREGAKGIAFAVNVETIKQVLSNNLSAGRLSGIQHGLRCTEKVAEAGPGRPHVLLGAVAAQTPAAVAGLRPGDEILRVGPLAVKNRFDVERALWGHRPGEQVPLTVARNGKQWTVDLVLAAAGGASPVASR